jgi:hypothetical protein
MMIDSEVNAAVECGSVMLVQMICKKGGYNHESQ